LKKTIEFYFSVISSYSYLSLPRVSEIVKETSASIILKPIDIMKVFAASNTTPPAKLSEARKAYRKTDLKRVARAHAMPINLRPAYWPAPQDLASGIIIAAQASNADSMPLAYAILQAVWAKDKNIADESTLSSIAQSCGFDGSDLLAQAKNENVQSAFKENTIEASKKGIFGSPSFIVEGELYWGQDRLDYLKAAL